VGRFGQDIGSGEPKDPIAGVEETVLAPVIRDEAVPMRAAVVLDDEALGRVVQVCAPQEIGVVAEPDLDTRSRQPAQDE